MRDDFMKQTETGKALAGYLALTISVAHRGAFVRGKELVIFGNDRYQQDSRARREVEAAFAWAREKGLEVTDFGTDPEEGYSWALVCHGGNPDELADLAVAAEDVLWRAWNGPDTFPLDEVFEHFHRVETREALKAMKPILEVLPDAPGLPELYRATRRELTGEEG
jgi:hypothetical protein